MSDHPKIARAMNHVAYVTRDTGATYRFYTEILGFRLVAAVRGDHDPESDSSKPHLHTFYAMDSGEVVAFFDIEGAEKPARDALPTWARHLALSVDSYEDLMSWRQRLLDHGVKVSPVVDHGGIWHSILLSRSQRRRARVHVSGPRPHLRRRETSRTHGGGMDQGARAADDAALSGVSSRWSAIGSRRTTVQS